MDIMEEKEEGEISLEDVSSSDEGPAHYRMSWMQPLARSPAGKAHRDREVDMNPKDAGYGKENRLYPREMIGSRYTFPPTLHEKNDDLLPISSDDEVETVGVPGTSHQLHIRVGKKKRKKKKKKKNGGNDVMLMDDLVSSHEPDPIVLNVQKSRFDPMEIVVHRRRRSPSPRLARRHSPCARTRGVSRSPPRSPLRMYRPVFRRSPSPRNHYSRSPSPRRRSPRRLRSPRKSPVLSSRDKSPRRCAPGHRSPDRYADHYASSLLKKVRQLETVGTASAVNRKHKEQGSSLKDKLSNILKGNPEAVASKPQQPDVIKKEEIKSEDEVLSDNQEEEDLELLRKQALETKQQKSDKTPESKNSSAELEHLSDNDNEDLELRMIALRSAVMKKHQKRVKKGGKKKMKESARDMSPLFADSFLNDLGEDDEQNQSADSSPSMSPTNQQVEDMDLDTDVEREKENYSEPYSPTDEVMKNTTEDDYLSSHSENQLTNGFSGDNEDNVNLEAPYSPSDPTKTPWVDRFKKSGDASSLEDAKTIIKANLMDCDVDSNEEAPYSPSDTPVYDPEIPYSPSELIESQNDDNCTVLDLSMKEIPTSVPKTVVSPDKNENKPSSAPPPDSLTNIEPKDVEKESNDFKKSGNSEKNENLEKNSHEETQKISAAAKEPLYLQGIPDVTKDANKIPTLVNRTLVPVSILKTNKKLQQPLPQKKVENHVEPAFRSAEMQPVDLVTQPVLSNAGFKPIKLQAVVKKPAVVVSAAAFNSSLTEETTTTVETPKNDLSPPQDKKDEEIKEMNVPEDENSRANRDGKTAARDEVLQSGGKRGKRRRGSRARRSQKRRSALANILNNSEANSTLDESLIEKNQPLEKPEKLKSSQLPEERSRADVNNLKRSENKSKEVPSCDTERENKGKNNGDKGENPEKCSENKGNESKKRRNSIEEDEDTLRAILLASLAKRPKPSENTAPKSLESVSKSSETVSKSLETVSKSLETVSKSSEIPSKISEIKEIDKAKTPELAAKPSAPKEIPQMVPKPQIVAKPQVQQSEIGTVKKNPASTAAKLTPPVPSTGPTVQLNQKSGSLVAEAKKRLNPSIVRGPPKKIIKKVSIPISTKVVNNAKKFQNIMMQKKLLQQKLKMMAITSRNLTLNNVKTSETPAPVSPKSAVTGKVQRLVINLGEDSETDSEEDREADVVKPVPVNEPRVELSIPTTDFEKSVDQFLKEQRKKQESMVTANPVTSTPTSAARISPGLKKSSSLSATPLAVRHLSLLQQEEYKRLKQQILEKERQQASRQKSSMTPPSPVSPASPIARATKPGLIKTAVNPITSTDSELKATANTAKIPQSAIKIGNNAPIKAPISQEKSQLSAPTQPMTNLSIQIPNYNSANGVRIVSNKDDNIERNPVNSVPVLRILSREQVNMKFVQVQLKHGEENRRVIVNEQLMQMNGEENVDSDGNCGNLEGNEAEINRINLNETDKLVVNDQTNQENDAASETVDSEASTVVLPPRTDVDETAESSRNATGDTTIVLDDTVQEQPSTPVVQTRKKTRNSKSPVNEHSERIKSFVRSGMEAFARLSEEEQANRLVEMEGNLVTKRHAVLEDLSEMSGTLQQWDMERELQTNLVAEVKRLRLQLAMAEERLKEQRSKIEEIAPKVAEAHKTIVNGRTECFKLTKLCQGFGTKVVGPQYKVPIAGAQLMMEKLKEVAYHTRELSKKKVPYVNNNGEASPQIVNNLAVSGDSDSSAKEQSDGENSDNSSGSATSKSIEVPSTDVLNREMMPGSSSTPSVSAANRVSLNDTESPTVQETTQKQAHRAKPYESVLSHFGTPRHIDMHRELCPFELTGICKDYSCLYNHLDPTRKQ